MAKIKTVIDRDVPEDQVDDIVSGRSGSDSREERASIEDITGSSQGGPLPLFPDLSIKDSSRVRELEVHRISPNEGHVGTIDPYTTLDDLGDRFGGKRLLVKAMDASHRYVVQRSFDIAKPPKKPEDEKPKGDTPGISAVLEGLGSLHDRLDNSNGNRGDTDRILELFVTKSDTEKRLAEIKLEEIQKMQDARYAEMQLKQEDEKKRFDREMELKEKEINSKLELAKQEIELKKAQIDADRVRMEKESKEARESWERRQQEENQRRKDELDRIEASRKADLDRMRQEAKDKEERDRQFYASQTEGQQKFQVLMAQLSKQKESGPLESLQLIQAVREMFDGGDGEEKQDPMSKLMEALPMVASAIANRGAAPMQLPPRPVMQRRPPTVPEAPPQEVDIPMHSTTRKGKKGGKVMPAAPTQPQQKAMPPWATMLGFAVQYLSVEIMGDIIDELHEHKNKPISDNIYAQITQAPIDAVKGFLRSINPVFTDNTAVWNKLVAVREYLNLPPEDDEPEEEEINTGAGFDLNSFGAPEPVPPVGEPAKEGSGVDL